MAHGAIAALAGALRRHPLRLPFTLVLFAALGIGSTFIGRQLWARYHFRAAEQAASARDFRQAYAHISRCVEVWPNQAAVQLLAARYARRADMLQEASEHLKSCQDIEGVTRENALEGSLLRAQTGALTEVEDALHRFVMDKHPDSITILEALAKGYILVYRLNDAMIALHQLLELDAVHGPALMMRGRILDAADRTMLALADFRRAVELYPDRDDWRQELAEMLMKHNFANEALPHLLELRKRHDDHELLLDLAQALRKSGEPDEARRVVDELLAAHPTGRPFADTLAERGVLEKEAGQLAEAEAYLREGFRLDPTSYHIGYHLYECLGVLGKDEEAARLLDHLMKMKADRARVQRIALELAKVGKSPELRYEAGTLCMRQDLEDEGLRWFMSALQDDPNHVPTHAALADYYERHKQADLATYHRGRAGR